MITTVTRQQFFTALAAMSEMNTIYQSLLVDANYPEWIEFNAAKYVKQGDPLYVQTQMVLGYTSDQMQFLFDLAVNQTVIPAQFVRARNGIPVLDRSGANIETRPA